MRSAATQEVTEAGFRFVFPNRMAGTFVATSSPIANRTEEGEKDESCDESASPFVFPSRRFAFSSCYLIVLPLHLFHLTNCLFFVVFFSPCRLCAFLAVMKFQLIDQFLFWLRFLPSASANSALVADFVDSYAMELPVTPLATS